MLTKTEIVDLWTDPKFPASFSPAHTFFEELKRAGYEVPEYSHILSVLEDLPTYQIHSLYRDKKVFRHLENVPGQGIQV